MLITCQHWAETFFVGTQSRFGPNNTSFKYKIVFTSSRYNIDL